MLHQAQSNLPRTHWDRTFVVYRRIGRRCVEGRCGVIFPLTSTDASPFSSSLPRSVYHTGEIDCSLYFIGLVLSLQLISRFLISGFWLNRWLPQPGSFLWTGRRLARVLDLSLDLLAGTSYGKLFSCRVLQAHQAHAV